MHDGKPKKTKERHKYRINCAVLKKTKNIPAAMFILIP